VGTLALGGSRFSQGKAFLPDLLAKGPVPVLAMGILAAVVGQAFFDTVGKQGEAESWV
jgi:hypothetical protein